MKGMTTMKLYTAKVVARWLDLSERRVRQLRDEGIIEEKKPGLYDLFQTVQRYIKYLRGGNLNEERARLTKEKRIAIETENRVRQGELYRKEDIAIGMTTIFMNLRSRMIALSNKLAPTIAKLGGSEDEIMDVLKDAFYEILEEFSDYEKALKVPDDEDEESG